MTGYAKVRYPLENNLLSRLPDTDCERLLPNLKQRSFTVGEVIYEPDALLDRVYFPTSSVVSLFYTTKEGSTAEIGLIGNEGVLGIALFLGGGKTSNWAVAQIAGEAYGMKARLLREEFARGGPFQNLMLRYTQSFITQVSQTAICNRLHPIEKRLCRWLLLSHDRMKCDELLMTQEFIANILGGRRESVTLAAGRLRDAGLIHYSRGHIAILDRKGLESIACECYHTVKKETDRLLGKSS